MHESETTLMKARSRQTKTTGDIARAVGCNGLTVRRWLKAHGYKRPEGGQFAFSDEPFREIVARIKVAHIRYPNHVNRFEKNYGADNQRIPLGDC